MPWSASYCRSIWGSLINLSEIYHGVATDVQVIKDNTLLFKDLPENFEAGRYHSWAVANENFPEELEITAVDDKGTIMALQHKNTISTLYSFIPKVSLHHKVKLSLETFKCIIIHETDITIPFRSSYTFTGRRKLYLVKLHKTSTMKTKSLLLYQYF